MKNIYTSLEDLRADKAIVGHRLRRSLAQMQEDVSECFMPSDSLAASGNRYMRFFGYGMTAYKAFTTVRKVYGLINKWKK